LYQIGVGELTTFLLLLAVVFMFTYWIILFVWYPHPFCKSDCNNRN